MFLPFTADSLTQLQEDGEQHPHCWIPLISLHCTFNLSDIRLMTGSKEFNAELSIKRCFKCHLILPMEKINGTMTSSTKGSQTSSVPLRNSIVSYDVFLQAQVIITQ